MRPNPRGAVGDPRSPGPPGSPTTTTSAPPPPLQAWGHPRYPTPTHGGMSRGTHFPKRGGHSRPPRAPQPSRSPSEPPAATPSAIPLLTVSHLGVGTPPGPHTHAWQDKLRVPVPAVGGDPSPKNPRPPNPSRQPGHDPRCPPPSHSIPPREHPRPLCPRAAGRPRDPPSPAGGPSDPPGAPQSRLPRPPLSPPLHPLHPGMGTPPGRCARTW